MPNSHLKFCSIAILTCGVFTLTACNDKPDSKDSVPPIVEQPATSTASSPIETQATQVAPTTSAIGDTTENALDWAGSYEGVLPCADCEGIQVELELDSDKTYELKETYLGKGNQSVETKGSFQFDAKNPTQIILDEKAQARRFFIGEGFAEARALDGSEIDTNLKQHYKLTKEK